MSETQENLRLSFLISVPNGMLSNGHRGPSRWRDWAAKEDGISGDALKHFINFDEAVRPDGSKGAGLLAYLRGMQSSNGDDRRDVIASVFAGVNNRMESGYLLRDVINKVNGIHFDSTEEIHTLGHLYESMLKEMRDAAGDSGEFYTPRAVVRFMVQVANPQLGEAILDPACGTGGFLVESFQHLEKQCRTVQGRRVLQEKSIAGKEAKPLPYMLAQRNLLLHGLEAPQLTRGNSVIPGSVILPFLEYALADFNVSVFNFASAQAKLNQKNARKIRIPVPPLIEQERIVQHLNILNEKLTPLRNLQDESQKELSAMQAAILDRAFRGEL